MLYLCIPIKLVEEYQEIENKLAEVKQTVTYLITKNNFQLVIETIKIFSILSRNHQRDIINILQTILDWKENIS